MTDLKRFIKLYKDMGITLIPYKDTFEELTGYEGHEPIYHKEECYLIEFDGGEQYKPNEAGYGTTTTIVFHLNGKFWKQYTTCYDSHD